MTSANFSYSGKDNLAAMIAATRYNAFLADLIEVHSRPGDHLLDFGAGLGTFADALKSRNRQISCLEIDAILHARLEARGHRTIRTPEELEDESIDFVYSLNVLEHIDDDLAALSALVPKIRPGGRCLVYVPAFPVLFSEMDRVVGHYRRYTARTLRRVLEGAGLDVVRVGYVDSLGFAAGLAYRLLRGRGTLDPASIAFYDRWVFPVSLMLDKLSHRWIGKNVYALGVRRAV